MFSAQFRTAFPAIQGSTKATSRRLTLLYVGMEFFSIAYIVKCF